MTQRILCPVDFSECSHAALTQALAIGKPVNAHIDVLHAYYVPENIQPTLQVWMATGPRPIIDLAGEQAKTDLDEFLRRHGPDIHQRVHVHLVHQDPTEAILNFATQNPTTLIVMGTHGRTGASRLFTGSVAERIVRRAPCPVLTVREHPAPHAKEGQPS